MTDEPLDLADEVYHAVLRYRHSTYYEPRLRDADARQRDLEAALDAYAEARQFKPEEYGSLSP